MLFPESKTVPININTHILPTTKFKTIIITVFIQQILDKELAARTALIPAVLERGTSGCPTYRDLRKRLEELYGAELTADVSKKGEKHVLTFSLEVINDKFVPGEKLLRRGLELLKDVLADPLLENGTFKSSYVEQEKRQLEKEINSLINDKISYALERCIQNMCYSERFGVFKYGAVSDLEKITPETLYQYYVNLLAENPIDIVIVGEVEPEKTYSLVEDIFSFSRSSRLKEIPPAEAKNVPAEIRYFQEKLPVNQGKLNLGYRTNFAYSDDEYLALLFYNGILGGFPHSKLFQNVREKASLAYYVFSRLEKHKGIQLIGSGIDVENYELALEIIEKQVELVRHGEISQEEMENTRIGLINQYKTIGDSPYNLVNFFLDGLVGESAKGLEYYIEGLQSVKKDDVVEIAQKVYLDTVYFLRSPDGEERGETV